MKKCSECDIEMIDGDLHGEPFVFDMDHEINDFSIIAKTGNQKKFLGFNYDERKEAKLKSRFCPKCGKVELYINPNDLVSDK